MGDTLVFDVGLSLMSKNNGHSMVKNLACLAILVGFVWLIYPTIFSSPLSGELSHDFGVVFTTCIIMEYFRFQNLHCDFLEINENKFMKCF